ncbi:MAG TPA: class I SAM-dependent methyltransferase [Polyangia bacterium]|jgi:SAM-dependent methyltransferase
MIRQTSLQTTIEPQTASPPAPDRYTFGDSALAADRLALLAATYEPSSARLLRLCTCLGPRRAIDLGCGPGHSTRLLHAVVAPASTIGIDSSPEHVARARATAPPGVEYAVHDVTVAPLPGAAPPDLLYCRFLLTHLRDPARVLAAWAAASAAERATLVIEETAEMSSPHPAFRLCYQLVADLQRHYGQQLLVGRTLDRALAGAGWQPELDVVRELSLPARRMARLHALNLVTWRQDPFARAAFAPATLDGLAAALEAIASGAADAPDVRHSMRQLVLMKTGGMP